jgi:AraC-like DNA-binding protein
VKRLQRSGEKLEGDFFQKNMHLYMNRVAENFERPFHFHDFIELAYVAEGQGFHYIDNEIQRVHKGQLFVIPIGVSHVFRPTSPSPSSDPLIVFNCVFTPEIIDILVPSIMDEPIAAHLVRFKENDLSPYSIFDIDSTIEKLFNSFYREYSIAQSGSFTYLHSLLVQLIVTIYRLKNDEIQTPISKPTQFLHVLRYLEQYHSIELTLSLLSNKFQWSERHLQRLFQHHTGQTFNRYIQSLRIQKSCEHLRNSQLKINLIAEEIGYKDLDSFNAVFKRIMGMTPSSYRKQMGSKTISKPHAAERHAHPLPH